MFKTIAKLNLVLTTAMTVYSATRLTKYVIQEIAETEKVHSAREYVLVRAARGHYSNVKGIQMIRDDLKFYEIISHYHEA